MKKLLAAREAREAKYHDEYARWVHGILHGFTVDYGTCPRCNPKRRRKGGG